MRQTEEMTATPTATDSSDMSLAEFFAEIESGAGPSLTADDHRALVADVRSGRERAEV